MPLTDTLRVLEKAGLISLAAVRPEPEFSFRHALVHQAVYNTYLKSQRRLVHQVTAEVLEAACTDAARFAAATADLAYHYFEAGQWDKAMDYARQSGERAQARYAPREAASHFTLALEAAQQLGLPPPNDLLRARGQAHETLGQFEQAQADYAAALEQGRAAGRWRDEWQGLLDLGFLWTSRDYARTGDFYRHALQLAERMGDESALAHSLNRLGNWHFNVGENLAALDCYRRALATFDKLADRHGLADTLDHLGMVETVIGHFQQGRNDYLQAIKLFREQDNRLGLSSSLATLAEHAPSPYTETGIGVMAAEEAMGYGNQALAVARDIGARPAEAYALNALAGIYVAQGNFAAGLPLVREALQVSLEIGHRQWRTFALTVYCAALLDLLCPSDALAHAEEGYAVALELNSSIWLSATRATLALCQTRLGRLAEAEATLAPQQPRDRAPSLHDRLVVRARVELTLAQGLPSHALAVVSDLIATTPDQAPGVVVPRLWELRGRARAALGDWLAAAADLQAACAASLRQGTRPHAWRCQADLARAYDTLGRAAEAEAERAAASTLVKDLAASVPDTALREHFLREATRVIHGRPA